MSDAASLKTWLAEPPPADVQRALDRLRRAPDVVHVAVMPDVHLAAAVSNGVAIATRRLIYPAAVGGDIGCGYAAIAFGPHTGEDAGSSLANRCRFDDGASARAEARGSHSEKLPRCADPPSTRGQPIRRSEAEALFAALPEAVPIMRHRRRRGLPALDESLAPDGLSSGELASRAAGDGRLELGTVGRGNHFVELQADDDGRLWLMVHSGSRAMGQFITAHHLQHATRLPGGLAWLAADDERGRAYLADVAWARAYAARSRRLMIDAAAALIADVLGCEPDEATFLDTDHNHVQIERCGGGDLWVHRKGANVATDGAANVIPGSMGTHTYHVTGRGELDALASSSHGAGRRMSRTEARRRIRRTDLRRQIVGVWIDARSAASLRDEAPAAYKDVDAVMRAQRDLVRIVRRVRPVLSYKGMRERRRR